MDLRVETRSPEETRDFARRFGEALRPGDVIALSGDLGSGKTQFVKGLALGLGLPDGDIVTSPTFVLMNRYEGRLPLRHFDFYRLDSVDLESLGYFDGRGETATVVEWAEKAGDRLGDRLEVILEVAGPARRRIRARAIGAAPRELLERAAPCSVS